MVETELMFNELYKKCIICCSPVELRRVLVRGMDAGKHVKTEFRVSVCNDCSNKDCIIPVPVEHLR